MYKKATMCCGHNSLHRAHSLNTYSPSMCSLEEAKPSMGLHKVVAREMEAGMMHTFVNHRCCRGATTMAFQ